MKFKRTFALLVCLAVASFSSKAFSGVEPGDYLYDVTVTYVVQDNDRDAEDVPRVQAAFEEARQLVAEEMERNGFGAENTFNFNLPGGLGGMRVLYEKEKDVNYFETVDVQDLYTWVWDDLSSAWDNRERPMPGLARVNRVFLVLVEGAR